jgi:hypothetical protein
MNKTRQIATDSVCLRSNPKRNRDPSPKPNPTPVSLPLTHPNPNPNPTTDDEATTCKFQSRQRTSDGVQGVSISKISFLVAEKEKQSLRKALQNNNRRFDQTRQGKQDNPTAQHSTIQCHTIQYNQRHDNKRLSKTGQDTRRRQKRKGHHKTI